MLSTFIIQTLALQLSNFWCTDKRMGYFLVIPEVNTKEGYIVRADSYKITNVYHIA